MTNASASPVVPINRGRGTHRSNSRASLRSTRQAQEVLEKVDARIIQLLEQYRDVFKDIKDNEKAIKLLEKRGAVSDELFTYRPRRLSIIRDRIAVMVEDKSLKLDANKVPYLARDPDELHAQLAEEVSTTGMTSLKAQAIAHQRALGQQAS